MSTVYVTLPASMEIGGVTHVREFRTQYHVIVQNYTDPRATSNQPLLDRTPQIAGQNWFKVFAITRIQPFGEELGALVATYGDLQSAMTFVEKAEQLA